MEIMKNLFGKLTKRFFSPASSFIEQPHCESFEERYIKN